MNNSTEFIKLSKKLGQLTNRLRYLMGWHDKVSYGDYDEPAIIQGQIDTINKKMEQLNRLYKWR